MVVGTNKSKWLEKNYTNLKEFLDTRDGSSVAKQWTIENFEISTHQQFIIGLLLLE